MKVYLDTVGCRLNQSEIETFARQFRAAGHTLVPSPDQADLVVVNTCAVTAAAESDSRQKIRQASRSGAGEIVATGCWVTLAPQEAASLPGVSRIVPNSSKDVLVPQVLGISTEAFDWEPIQREPIPGARSRTRAFIKVQDGCDNRCAFCVTTIARGSGVSRPLPQVLSELRALEKSGVKEIVLTGVHIGSWGRDLSPRSQLYDLVQAILAETDFPRVRLSSLEPWDLDEGFFQLWESPRLCRHLHLPLQSGCSATLRRMARRTSPTAFAALVAAARAFIPQVAVTTDIITGFPGEEEAEFTESLAFVREMQFSGGHVFTYSARPGTSAARMPGQVPHALRKERNTEMRLILEESAKVYRHHFLGAELPVLWESSIPDVAGFWQVDGLTSNYLRVMARSPQPLSNEITHARLNALSPDGLFGIIH